MTDPSRAALAMHPDGTPQVSIGPAMDLASVRKLAAQPLAPAIPLNLDELLSPEGAYERGTFQEDGAQLLLGEWWVPIYGCDTLDNLLDRIRSRILPHLRPPIAGIDVPGGDGDYGGLQEICNAEGVDVCIGVPLLKRARKAWKAAAQPPAAAPASDGEREALIKWLTHMAQAGLGGRDELNAAAAATLLRNLAPAGHLPAAPGRGG